MLDQRPPIQWPLSNVWVGVSVENQRMSYERLWWLLNTPAAVRFLSVEPLLGMIDLGFDAWFHPEYDRRVPAHAMPGARQVKDLIQWVIVGGKSGSRQGSMKLRWLEYIVAQCDEARVPVWVKQDSAFRPGQQGAIPDALWHRKEFPIDKAST
jgi:protein gp37